jgi:hypothetical protein
MHLQDVDLTDMVLMMDLVKDLRVAKDLQWAAVASAVLVAALV